MFKFRKMCPDQIEENLFAEILRLNNEAFEIHPETVKKALLKKDIVHLFFDNTRLIGVLGFSWTKTSDGIFLYIGSAVIDNQYMKAGLLSRSLLRNIIYTYVRYPFHKKYAVALSTTPHAFSYFDNLHEHWPRPDVTTPKEVLRVMENYMHGAKNQNFLIKNGVIIDNGLLNLIAPKHVNDENVKNYDYFRAINPNAHQGSQVLCMVPFTFTNFYNVIKKFVHKKIRHSAIFRFAHQHIYAFSAIILTSVITLSVIAADFFDITKLLWGD